jgi:poly(3-hydroxybutyrate) depolymerase
VDESRIYATGFSNGGGFVLTRLMLEMNDVFAAFATSGAGLWGENAPDEPPTGIDASLYSVLGSNDAKVAEGTEHPLPFPMLAEEIYADPLLNAMIVNTTAILSLDTAYRVEYDRPSFTTLTFDQSLGGANNQFVFRMANGMGHVYPSGDNNRLDFNASDLFWTFFQQYSK